MSVRGLSDWSGHEERINERDFFLGMDQPMFSDLYDSASLRYKQYLQLKEQYDKDLKEYNKKNKNGKNQESPPKPPKEVKPPAEQLSPKGLALISAIYAQHDKSEVQPLIADSVESLKHISKLMDDAPQGSSVTVIFQPTNTKGASMPNVWRMLFSPVHKTVLKFERTNEGIRLIQIDGTNSTSYTHLSSQVVSEALAEKAKQENKTQTKVSAYAGVAKDLADPNKKREYQGRQKSEFECGIFATKDARELSREFAFHEKYLQEAKKNDFNDDPNLVNHTYEVPIKFMKSLQSTTAYKAMLDKLGSTVVTRKGRTLQQTFEKHADSYANHFAQKYNKQVEAFVKEKSADEIKAAVEKYDAGKITLDRLVKVYGPKQMPGPPQDQVTAQSKWVSAKPNVTSSVSRQQPLAPNVAVKQILDLDFMALSEQYHEARADQGKLGWAKNHAKDIGGALGGKAKTREAQLHEMEAVFKLLKESKGAPDRTTPYKLASYLQVTINEIKKEHNLMDSSLQKMCENMLNQLGPAVKEQALKGNIDKIADALRADIKKPTSKIDPPTAHSQKNRPS